MDDKDQLSEEDFLRAALSVESFEAVDFAREQHFSFPDENSNRTNHSAARDKFKDPKMSFNIFMDSDDSDLDLSLSAEISDNLCKTNDSRGAKCFSKDRVGTLSNSFAHTANDDKMESNIYHINTASKHWNTVASCSIPMVSESSGIFEPSKIVYNSVYNGKSLEKKELEDALLNPGASDMLTSVDPKRKRKFPGPAGVLPKLRVGSKMNDDLTKQPQAGIDRNSTASEESAVDVSCSQSLEMYLHSRAWAVMKEDLGVNAELITKDYCINSIIKKANAKLLPKGKVPVFCAVIEAVKVHSADASVTLRDSTGVIYGTMHRELLKNHLEEIQVGTVIVLRQVGVLCPSGGRNCYLNITPNNVVGFYLGSVPSQPLKVMVRSLTEDDLEMLKTDQSKLHMNGAMKYPREKPERISFKDSLFSSVANKTNNHQLFSGPNSISYQSKAVPTFGKTTASVSSHLQRNSPVANNLSNAPKQCVEIGQKASMVKQPNLLISKSTDSLPKTPQIMALRAPLALHRFPRPLAPSAASSQVLSSSRNPSTDVNCRVLDNSSFAKENGSTSVGSTPHKSFRFKPLSAKSSPITKNEVSSILPSAVSTGKNNWNEYGEITLYNLIMYDVLVVMYAMYLSKAFI